MFGKSQSQEQFKQRSFLRITAVNLEMKVLLPVLLPVFTIRILAATMLGKWYFLPLIDEAAPIRCRRIIHLDMGS